MTRERAEYLRDVSEDFGIDIQIVWELAELLGESEDQDGLLTTLEDML